MTIGELESEIRTLVDDNRRKTSLMQNLGTWFQVGSCMDVVGDTAMAIASYLKQETKDKGELYLLTYGVLQALVIQQDAARHLAQRLGHPIGPWERYPRLANIRRVRNRAAGHPSKTRAWKDDPEQYHSIVQISLQVGYFKMLSESDSAEPQFEEVDVTALASDQEQDIGGILRELRDALRGDDEREKEKFRNDRLADIFQTTGYAVEKLTAALDGRELITLGRWGLDAIQGAVRDLKERVAKRGLTFDSLDHICSDLEFPFEKIGKALIDGPGSGDDRRTAYFLARFASEQLRELGQLARGIDSTYLKESPEPPAGAP